MTAEKPEGDVALLCDWLRKHTESGVPIPFAAERAIILLEELDDARGAAAFYVRESDGIRDAVVKQGARIESQATRIATLSAEAGKLRVLLAYIYAGGAMLYTDDGELQDNLCRPLIDFKRDSPDELEEKMIERSRTKAAQSAPLSNEQQWLEDIHR